MDFANSAKRMFANDKVNVIGGDLQSGEWEYKTGTLWHAFDQVDLSGQIKTISQQTEESVKKLPEMAAWGLAGSMIFGPLGLLAGLVMGGNRKKICAMCELKDGRKFLATMDTTIYQEMLAMSLHK
jgi:hypothetical protein